MARRKKVRVPLRAQVATGFGSNLGAVVVTDLSQRKMLTDRRSQQATKRAYGRKRR